jgi:hypothetical protein
MLTDLLSPYKGSPKPSRARRDRFRLAYLLAWHGRAG